MSIAVLSLLLTLSVLSAIVVSVSDICPFLSVPRILSSLVPRQECIKEVHYFVQ